MVVLPNQFLNRLVEMIGEMNAKDILWGLGANQYALLARSPGEDGPYVLPEALAVSPVRAVLTVQLTGVDLTPLNRRQLQTF